MPGDGPAPATEQRGLLQPPGDLHRAHHAHPCGGELDAERQPVEPGADGGHRVGGVRVEPEVRRRRAGTLHEQRRGVLERQRRHRPQLLPLDAERLPAGREDHHLRALLHDVGEEPRGVRQHVLAVVHDEQQGGVRRYSMTVCSIGQAGTLLDPQRRGDGVPDGAPVGQGRELAEPGPVVEARPVARRHLHREPRLPRAPDAGQGDQGARAQGCQDAVDLVLPSHEPAGPPGEVSLPCRCGERRVVEQDAPVERLRRSGRLDAQLVVEAGAQLVVGGERVGLPSRRVQRLHQRDRRPLPRRVAEHQPLQLRYRLGRPAERDQCLGAVLDRARAQLGQPGGRGPGEVVVGELGERVAPPRASAASRSARARPWSPAAAAARGPGELLEYGGVEGRGVQGEAVARWAVLQRRGGAENAPQPRDVGPERRPRSGGRGVPHSASTRRSAGTTSPPATSRTARSVRGLAPPRATAPPSTSTCSGPRIRKRAGPSTVIPPACTRDARRGRQ